MPRAIIGLVTLIVFFALSAVSGLVVVALMLVCAHAFWAMDSGYVLEIRPSLSFFCLAALPISFGLAHWMIWRDGRLPLDVKAAGKIYSKRFVLLSLFALIGVGGLIYVRVLLGRTFFLRDGIAFRRLDGIRLIHADYRDLVSMTETTKVRLPDGSFMIQKHLVLRFGNGVVWDNTLDNDSNANAHAEIADLIESKTGLPLETREFLRE